MPAFGLLLLTNLSFNSFAIEDIGSREYKLMLQPEQFNHSNPINTVIEYWAQLKAVLKQHDIERDTSGQFKLDKQRTIQFFDVAQSCDLNNEGYIFRQRAASGQHEITLKYRSPDRFLAAHHKIKAKGKAETKFEEDISAPFVSKYSYSSTLNYDKSINKIETLMSLYPSLKSQDLDKHKSLSLVSGLTVFEKVYKGTYIDLGRLDAKFALTLWYDNPTTTKPMVAEISFKYKDTKADYSNKVVSNALKVFQAMQTMDNWVAKDSKTKTKSVFNYITPPFCDEK